MYQCLCIFFPLNAYEKQSVVIIFISYHMLAYHLTNSNLLRINDKITIRKENPVHPFSALYITNTVFFVSMQIRKYLTFLAL